MTRVSADKRAIGDARVITRVYACATCSGTGRVEREGFEIECDTCHGKGSVDRKP